MTACGDGDNERLRSRPLERVTQKISPGLNKLSEFHYKSLVLLEGCIRKKFRFKRKM